MNSTSACGHAARISLAHSLVTFLGVVTSTGSAQGPSNSGAMILSVRLCRYASPCGWIGKPGASEMFDPPWLRLLLKLGCVALAPAIGEPGNRCDTDPR